ncbi:MAG: phosphatase PAP2 family protein [Subdoligranulum variabile]|nr:phosphatase PAP2 family protein [Subdoligranulum variabile]
MNAQQYRAVIGWFNARPAAKKVLWAVSIGAVAAVYLLYLGLLSWLAWHAMWAQLGVTVVVPAAAFVVGTALRAAIDRPRPYTKYGFVPLFPKNKTGQSMPSRHCFSAAAIAAAVWYVLPPLGAVLAVLAAVIAVSRVITGVHFVSDVLAGLAFGLVFAVAGRVAYIAAASALGYYAIMIL